MAWFGTIPAPPSPAQRSFLPRNLRGWFASRNPVATGRSYFPADRGHLFCEQKEGFSTEQMNALRMEVGELASINVVLHIGEIRTAIRISLPTEAELKAESSAIGSVVDSGQVQQLPLNGRNFLNLGLLTADVTPANNLFSSNVGPPSRTVVLPATLPSSASYSLNGINVTGSRDGELALVPR